MSDAERVQRMEELNWTPASTYWHRKYIELLQVSEPVANSLPDEHPYKQFKKVVKR